MDEAAEPLGHVANPAGLAVFAVADDVDADVRLLAHDAGDFVPQGLFVAPPRRRAARGRAPTGCCGSTSAAPGCRHA